MSRLFVMCDPLDNGPRMLYESNDRLWMEAEVNDLKVSGSLRADSLRQSLDSADSAAILGDALAADSADHTLPSPRAAKSKQLDSENKSEGSFDMIVVDEAHHIYRNAIDARSIEAHAGANTRCIYLTDVSQSEEIVLFPPGLKVVELTKVVRSSQRIVAGAAAFQVGGTKSECDHGAT